MAASAEECFGRHARRGPRRKDVSPQAAAEWAGDKSRELQWNRGRSGGEHLRVPAPVEPERPSLADRIRRMDDLISDKFAAYHRKRADGASSGELAELMEEIDQLEAEVVALLKQKHEQEDGRFHARVGELLDSVAAVLAGDPPPPR